MRLCMSPQALTICQHPLPCPVHGTREEEVRAVLPEFKWLIEPVKGGVLVTLVQEDRRVSETRWCACDDGSEGLRRLQDYLLHEACVVR